MFPQFLCTELEAYAVSSSVIRCHWSYILALYVIKLFPVSSSSLTVHLNWPEESNEVGPIASQLETEVTKLLLPYKPVFLRFWVWLHYQSSLLGIETEVYWFKNIISLRSCSILLFTLFVCFLFKKQKNETTENCVRQLLFFSCKQFSRLTSTF